MRTTDFTIQRAIRAYDTIDRHRCDCGSQAKAATLPPVTGIYTVEDAGINTVRGGRKMSKALVVYATRSGCTTAIAEHIGATMVDKGIEVDVVPATEAPTPDGYDAVVVGSGVRAGNWHAPARAWVEANAEQLKATPIALFTCGLMIQDPGKTDEVRAYTDPLIEHTGIQPVDIGLFAGWNNPEEFSLIERGVMKVMKAPEGDFRDLDEVGRWTEAVAPKLGLVQ